MSLPVQSHPHLAVDDSAGEGPCNAELSRRSERAAGDAGEIVITALSGGHHEAIFGLLDIIGW